MVEFEQQMDEHSLHINRDGKHIGYVHWHPNRQPCVQLLDTFASLTASEMWDCLRELHKRQKFQPPQDRPMER